MVALSQKSELPAERPQHFFARRHTDRFGASRSSKSSEQGGLRRRIYDELDQLESCSKDPIGYWDGYHPYRNNWRLSGVDPKGTIAAVPGACHIHLYRYPQYTGEGLIPVGDHIGGTIEWGPYSQEYIDGTVENEVEETHGRPRNRPDRPTVSFFNMSQEVCDCFSSSAEAWSKVPDEQRVRDELGRNSNWIMKCLLKRCGLSVNWGLISPTGWNGNTGKCLAWGIREGATMRCLWKKVCTKYQECPDGFDSSLIGLASGSTR